MHCLSPCADIVHQALIVPWNFPRTPYPYVSRHVPNHLPLSSFSESCSNEDRTCARHRLRRRPEAIRADPVIWALVRRARARGGFPFRRVQHRERVRQHRRASTRGPPPHAQNRLHRQYAGRQAYYGECGALEPKARNSRARGKEPDACLRRRGLRAERQVGRHGCPVRLRPLDHSSVSYGLNASCRKARCASRTSGYSSRRVSTISSSRPWWRRWTVLSRAMGSLKATVKARSSHKPNSMYVLLPPLCLHPCSTISPMHSASSGEGARVLAGGTRGEGSGFFVRPTLLVDATPDMTIVREEIFGPVGVIIKFKTEEEAVAQANDTVYGLAAYVHTQNVNRAIRVAHALESGQTFVSSLHPYRRTRLTFYIKVLQPRERPRPISTTSTRRHLFAHFPSR